MDILRAWNSGRGTGSSRGSGAMAAGGTILLALLFFLTVPAAGQDTLDQTTKHTLALGEELKSSNGQYTLTLRQDGNLVATDSQGSVIWQSGTAGRGVVEATMQGDGNLVLKSRLGGRAVWSSGTDGYENARLMIQNDGNLVIYNERGVPIWAKGKIKDVLAPGENLMAGEFIRSQNRQYTLRLQGDGNLVATDGRGRAIWNSGTGGSGAVEAVMQGDGNLVLRGAGGNVVWASNTDGHANVHLSIADGGRVVIAQQDGNGGPLWVNGTLSPSAKPAPAPVTPGTPAEPGRGNDAGSGRDAGSTPETAVLIGAEDSPVEGELSEADTVDVYAIELASGWQLRLKMVSMGRQDYNVAVLDPNGGVVAESARGLGQSEAIDFKATSTGTHYLRFTRHAGEGRYEFQFSIYK